MWKQRLLPLWNGGHQLAWRVGEYLDALGHRRFEHCTICGRFGPMLYRRRVIPAGLVERWGLSPRLAEALARKESCDCGRCGAKLRARRIASVVLEVFPFGAPAARTCSLAEWARRPEARSLRIAEINRIEGVHDVLRHLPLFTPSDFHPGAAPGAVVGGLVIGLAEELSLLVIPATYKAAIGFLAILVILTLKPSGLLGIRAT